MKTTPAATRQEKIIRLIGQWPALASLGARALDEGWSYSETQSRFLEALAPPQGSPGLSFAPRWRGEGLGDWLALQALGSLPIRDAGERERRTRNAEMASAALDLRRHGSPLRAVAELVSPAGSGDVSLRVWGGHDFPVIVQDASNLLLQKSFDEIKAPWRSLARIADIQDFKPAHVVRVGMSRLKVTPEGVPVPIATGAAAEGVLQLETFAMALPIGRALWHDDQLGILKTVADEAARAVSETISDKVFDVITANPVMAEDGIALFGAHVSGSNTTAAALDVTGFGSVISLLRAQTTLGSEKRAVRPSHLLVGPTDEGAGRKVLGDFGRGAADLELLVEPRVSSAFFIIAAGEPGLSVGALGGDLRPRIAKVDGNAFDGARITILVDFAATFTDHRGWVRGTA